jgi:hypothetical protein
MLRTCALGLCFAALAAGPAAAQVGLKKTSEIVHAFVQDGSPCPGFPSSNDGFSHRVLPDATLTPLVVPPKKVLIVRHLEIATSGGTPGNEGLVSVIAGVGGNYAIYLTRDVTLEPSGSTRFEIELPVGFPVPAGGSVCIHNTMGEEFGGRLEGYFAPAK